MGGTADCPDPETRPSPIWTTWQKAGVILGYLDWLEDGARKAGVVDDTLKAWLEWARKAADHRLLTT